MFPLEHLKKVLLQGEKCHPLPSAFQSVLAL